MSKTLAPLYANMNNDPVDVETLSDTLFLVTDYHEGMRMFCRGIIDARGSIEETSAARVILAALDAAAEHVNAIRPA